MESSISSIKISDENELKQSNDYECAASKWSAFLENPIDPSDSFLSLNHFFRNSSEDSIAHFCNKFPLEPIWEYTSISGNSSILELGISVLTNGFLASPSSFSFLFDPNVAEQIISFFDDQDLDISDSAIFLCASMCSTSQEFASTLIESGIIDKILLMPITDNYGKLIIQLCNIFGVHIQNAVDLASLCLHSGNPLSISDGINAIGCALVLAEENGEDNLVSYICDIIIFTLKFVSYTLTSPIPHDYILLLSKVEGLPIETADFILKFMKSQDDQKAIIVGADLLAEYADSWRSDIGDSLCEEIQKLYSEPNHSYKQRKRLAKLIYCYYDPSKFKSSYVKILIDFIEDSDICVEMINSFTSLMELHQSEPEMAELVVLASEKVFGALESEDPDTYEAAINFVESFRRIVPPA